MKSQIQYVHAVTHARFGLANERARALAHTKVFVLFVESENLICQCQMNGASR